MRKYFFEIFDDILKIKGYKSMKEIDITYEQGVILAKYVDLRSKYTQSLQCDITQSKDSKWLCYFKYFKGFSPGFSKNRNIIIVYLDTNFSTIYECIDNTPFTFSFGPSLLVN